MYDYLAKVILIGPSGTGKYVYSIPASNILNVHTDDKQVMFTPSLRQR
jgi:hypothetical protein